MILKRASFLVLHKLIMEKAQICQMLKPRFPKAREETIHIDKTQMKTYITINKLLLTALTIHLCKTLLCLNSRKEDYLGLQIKGVNQ